MTDTDLTPSTPPVPSPGWELLLKAARLVGAEPLRPEALVEERLDAAAELVESGWELGAAAAALGLRVAGGHIHAGEALLGWDDTDSETLEIPEVHDLEAWATERAQEAADDSVGSGCATEGRVITWSYTVEIEVVDADGDRETLTGYGEAEDQPPEATCAEDGWDGGAK